MPKSHKRKKRLRYANNSPFSTFRNRKKEKRYLKHSIKEIICNEYFIRKTLYKVRVESEYRIMQRIIRRNAHQKVWKFNRNGIVFYRASRLSFQVITLRIDRHESSVTRIWSQCVAEGHTKRHAGS